MKEFLSRAAAAGTGMLATLLLLIGGVALGVFVATWEDDEERPEKTVLTVDLSQAITDRGLQPSMRDAVSPLGGAESSLQLRRVLEALERAATDEHITAVYLHGGVSGGWAQLRELRGALDKIREAEKPIHAYFSSYGEREYYLAAMANPIIIPPFSAVQLDGFAAELLYLAGAFEKLGIEIQVTRVGKYKSAVEPLILEEMSEPNREQMENYLGDLFEVFVAEAAEARGIELADFRQRIADHPIAWSRDALEIGLVDQIAYHDEVYDALIELVGTGEDEEQDDEDDEEEDELRTFSQIALTDYIALLDDLDEEEEEDDEDEDEDGKAEVAVVFAEGSIVDGSGRSDIHGDTVAKRIRTLRHDEDVKALVLRVNSGGGSASASEVILREMRLTAENKPVIVSMGNVAASGGYWIASYANRILAQPNTITGSIGVFGVLPNAGGLLERAGLRVHTVKTGEYADLGSMYRPKSEAELALIQRSVDEIYDAFLDRVSEGRGLPRERVAEIAQGRVWSGVDALELGLVDALGTLDDAIVAAAEAAEIEDYDVRWPGGGGNKYMKQLEELFDDDDGDTPDLAQLEALTSLLEVAGELGHFNDPAGVYARMPFVLHME